MRSQNHSYGAEPQPRSTAHEKGALTQDRFNLSKLHIRYLDGDSPAVSPTHEKPSSAHSRHTGGDRRLH